MNFGRIIVFRRVIFPIGVNCRYFHEFITTFAFCKTFLKFFVGILFKFIEKSIPKSEKSSSPQSIS